MVGVDAPVFPVEEAQVAKGDLVAVELMRRRPGVDVLEVAALDVALELPLPSVDEELGVDLLLLDLLGGLHDDGVDRGLVAVVLLGVQPPGLFDGDLDRVRVVVLEGVQVDVDAPGVELRVNDAEAPELGVALLLAVVEPHDEEPVDLLHFSHSCRSFLLFVLPLSSRERTPPDDAPEGVSAHSSVRASRPLTICSHTSRRSFAAR